MTAPRYWIIALFTFLACTAAPQARSRQAAEQKEKEENVTKGSKNIDDFVNQPITALHRALKLGMETYGFEIKKDKPDYLEGTRDRKVGALVGSGGEKVKVALTAEKTGTRVKVETGKGIYGRLGKSNWSTPIFKEALKILDGK